MLTTVLALAAVGALCWTAASRRVRDVVTRAPGDDRTRQLGEPGDSSRSSV
jgi:hypothetical protein